MNRVAEEQDLLNGLRLLVLEGVMGTIKVSNFVEAPVERVFQLFTDFEHRPAHVSDIKRIEMLTSGPVRRGARWRETRETMGAPESVDMEITSFERNRTYTISHHKPGVQIATTYWFEPAPGGTRVSIEFALEPGGYPPGLAPLEWAIERTVAKMLSHDLADLKHSVES